jgi:hypothetical protein
MKIYSLIVVFLASFLLTAQQPKKDPEHYSYPWNDSYNPLEINVNVVLLYRHDGKGNFDLKDSEQKKLLEDYLQRINSNYSKFEKPADLKGCYTGTDFIADSKLRFKFNIIQVKNTFAWNYMNSGGNPDKKNFSGFTPTENWYIKAVDDSISNLANRPKAINAYFTTNGEKFDRLELSRSKDYDLSTNAASQYPTDKNLQRSSQLHQPNRYLKYLLHKYQAPIEYNTTWEETRNWHLNDSKGMSHELGHSFGLAHSNEYYSANTCKYSLMSQKGSDPRNWLPPTEIKKMHWNLTRTNLMQFVTPESHYGAVWYINENTTWDKPRRFYNNFEIAKNVTLTISETIILPPQAYIKLNKGSSIIFTGKGKLVDANGKEFKNFEKHKSAKIQKL